MKNKFFGDKKFTILIIFGSVVSLIFFPLKAALQTSNDTSKPFPIRRQESPETWRRGGEAAIERIKNAKKFNKRAKNVILFVGDGMGITTLTASRILEGQLRGESGEENSLSFEQFPNVALSKTYSVNQQTSDSAPTMSAFPS